MARGFGSNHFAPQSRSLTIIRYITTSINC